jgi:DNA-binding CsgD family transcriptional regulator/tetratricopeptide (TPR) repeat protein
MATTSGTTARGLLGRGPELEALQRALAATPDDGLALVLRGDPGVGKSVLLEHVAVRAADAGWGVLRTDGTPTERRLPLAGLHKLLRPVLGEAPRLPRPRRAILEGAFGEAEGRVDVFGVALVCLDLLSEVATRGPLAVVVDDAHWLDASSVEVLAFVARRLSPDPVLLLVATRLPGGDLFAEAGLPELVLGPLDESASGALIDSASPGLDPGLRARVLGLAEGNPLAVLELPLSLPRDAGIDVPDDLVPLTRRLERSFAGRVAELPDATRDLLLAAAVGDTADVADVLAVAGLVAGSARAVEDLEPAVAAGLVAVDDSGIRFRHPLVRSAVNQAASTGRRQAVHAALAAVTVDQPDRHAWHLAHAVTEPSESVARRLDDAAVRAERRGAVAAALQALDRAARLSESPVPRGRRHLRAAELAAAAGRTDLARQHLAQARPLLADPHDRLRVEAVAETTDESLNGGAARVEALVDLAQESLRLQDRDLALRFLLRAASRCWHLDFGGAVEDRVIDLADRLDVGDQDPRLVVIQANAAPFDRGGRVIEALRRRVPGRDEDPGDLLMYGFAGACVGAYAEAEAYCAAAAEGLREQGRFTQLAEALSLLAWSALRRARWQVAAPAAQECVRIAREIHQPIPEAAGLAAQAMIAGLRGDEGTDVLGAQAAQLASATRNTIGLAVTHLARGVTAAGLGHPDEAFDHLWHLFAPQDAARQRMQACRSLGHLAEAAVQIGRADEARAELARFAPLAARTPAVGVNVAMRYARAVLAEPDEAEQVFASALDRNWSDWPFEHGRLLLAYGSWLRRHQRVTESRLQLRAARDEFVRTGARPWVERARRELRAAGAAAPAAVATGWDLLSPQESQIARLVLEGLGNKEIGRRLYLSHRTVGSHLYRIFPKLGVSSRAQLMRALGGDVQAGTRPPAPREP